MSTVLDKLEWLVDRVESLSLFETVLLALGLLFAVQGLVRLWRIRAGRPGPVEVEDFVDGAKDTKVKQLTELVRERLSETGLFPPTTPVGSAPGLVAAAVKTAPLPQVQWLADVLKHIPGIVRPRYGHTVTGTAWNGQGEEVTIALEISDVASGRVEHHVVIHGDHRRVVQRAATEIYDEVVSHPPVQRKLKPWVRWPASHAEGLAALETGLSLEKRGELDEAIASYREAVDLEPTNATARLKLAQQLEQVAASETDYSAATRLNSLLEAVELYRMSGSLWPNLWEAEYRLAALLSFTLWWMEAWGTPDDAQRAQFEAVVGVPPPAAAPDLPPVLLARSIAAWDAVEGKDRPRKMWRVVDIARTCTKLQLAIHDEAAEELRALIAETNTWVHPFSHWAVRYNLVCFYSVATSGLLLPNERRRHGIAAIHQLDALASSGDNEFTVQMARHDPDLLALRNWLAEPELGEDPPLPASVTFWKRVLPATPA